jgi:hypothetical protein
MSGSDEDCFDHKRYAAVDWNNPDSYPCLEEKILLYYLPRLLMDGITVKEIYLDTKAYAELQREMGGKFTGFLYGPSGTVEVKQYKGKQ